MAGNALGERLRAARASKGYTLRELAREIGVSASLLSQVENGKSQASVTNLHALVTALDISLDELFASDGEAPRPSARPRSGGVAAIDSTGIDSTGIASTGIGPTGIGPSPHPFDPVHRPGSRPVLKMAGGVTWERLSSLLGHLVDAQLVTYEPGSSSSSDGTLTRHNGTEFAYLIEGRLHLRLGYDEFHLEAGDSLSFDSTTPHLYENLGDIPARGVWFELGRRVTVGWSSAHGAEPPQNGESGPPPRLH